MPVRRWGNFVQAAVLAVVAMGIMLASCRRLLPWALHRSGADTPDTLMGLYAYRLNILWPNYFENGFIRRGFSGTLKELIRRSGLIDPSAGFHIMNTILLLIPLLLLLRRLAAQGGRGWLWFATLLVLSPQLFLGWGADFGRSDMLAMSFVAWAALAFSHRRHMLAVAALLAGSLVHETAILYGAPLLAVLAWADRNESRLSLRQGARLAAFLLAGLIIIALAERLLGNNLAEIARTILRHDPANGPMAAFLHLGGLASIRASACMSFSDGTAGLKIAAVFIVLALYMPMLLPGSWRNLGVLVVASFLPMTLLCLIAIDYGRWLMMAVMNAWLASVVLHIHGQAPGTHSRRAYIVGSALLLVLILMRPARDIYANQVTQILSTALHTGFQKTFSECFPDWRSALDLPDGRHH